MKDKRINVAVHREVHASLKQEAVIRGMHLRSIHEFLLELVRVVTPEQEQRAMTRLKSRRKELAKV